MGRRYGQTICGKGKKIGRRKFVIEKKVVNGKPKKYHGIQWYQFGPWKISK